MSTFCLHISTEHFSVEDILSWSGKHVDPYTNEALTYCKHWLEGKAQFEFKTSGSTGTPKTIYINRSQIEASATSTIHFFKLKEGDVVSCPLSIHVVGGQMMLYRSIIGGLNLYVIPPTKNLNSLNTSIDYTFMPIAALQLFEVLNNQPEIIPNLNKLTHLLIGGSSLSEALLTDIRNTLTCKVWQSYGMTETVSHVALRSIHPTTTNRYTLLENIEAGTDDRFCLKIKGAVTNNEWLQTNDSVELLDEMHFIFLGRADFIVNSGGIKIQVEPIEKLIAVLFTELNVDASFFVGGIADDALGEKLILVVDTDAIDSEKKRYILGKLTGALPKYHVPKEIHTIIFEYTASEKVDRKKTLEKIKG